ncbi:Putative Adenylosuccinate synthetase [[Torrubiella] hemipterigena]|uniref:Putative Adenylosuccinate synthetase n=1 Tax=[Torrubiella] hemipterigena TaxID=1531966 RepID=A0A0A1TES9_9HYPO|nr:Putative Adenylosuccinate synthetase [[Torrubiella] hemipterigena]
MLDVNYGSYPFVTSSSTTLAGIIGGLTLNPKNTAEAVGVVKAYTTRLDVLDTFKTIKIAVAYKIDGEELESYPADLAILERAAVGYHEMPGWQTPTTNVKTYYELPQKARDYVEVSTGFGLG